MIYLKYFSEVSLEKLCFITIYYIFIYYKNFPLFSCNFIHSYIFYFQSYMKSLYFHICVYSILQNSSNNVTYLKYYSKIFLFAIFKSSMSYIDLFTISEKFQRRTAVWNKYGLFGWTLVFFKYTHLFFSIAKIEHSFFPLSL